MELHYCNLDTTEDEKSIYKTWRFVEWETGSNDYGWVKLPVPNEFCLPSSSEEVNITSLAYFSISNAEDRIFLEKEHQAFTKYYLNQLDEIRTAQRANVKLL